MQVLHEPLLQEGQTPGEFVAPPHVIEVVAPAGQQLPNPQNGGQPVEVIVIDEAGHPVPQQITELP